MRDVAKNSKLSKILSGLSVVLSLIAIIISLLNMRFYITNGKDTKSVVVPLLSGIIVFLVCTAQFITIKNKYKQTSKRGKFLDI